MQPFAQQAAEYPSLFGMLPYFSAGVRKISCNRVHFHAITGKKERQRRCMNVAQRPKRFGSSANFAAAFYGNPPLRGHLRSAGGLPGRHTGAGVLRGAGLCFTEQRFINGSFLSGFMLFYALSFAFRSISLSPTGLFLLQMRLLRKSPGRAGQKNCTERPLHFSLTSNTINKQRVAFLRKSGCRNAARFFCECVKLHQQIVRQKCVSPGFADRRISYVLKERKME